MNALRPDAWTTVAHRIVHRSGTWLENRWQWVEGANPMAILNASDADTVVLMHRHTGAGVELVARLAGPGWKRFRVAVRQGRVHWPQASASPAACSNKNHSAGRTQ